MATIRDVAKLAGVAPITVSRVLNNSGYVSLETRTKVEAAARELNYVPNMLARSFRSSQTHTLALVLSDITNPFWTTVARGVEDVANTRDYHVIFCNTDENAAKQEEYLTVLLQRRVDGVLLVPAESEPHTVQKLQHHNVPIVVLDRRVPGARVDVIRGMSTKGSRRLIEHLIDMGHTRIAVLAGPDHVSVSNERIQGYQQAMNAAGLAMDPDLVLNGDFTIDGGVAMTNAVLNLDPRPTAIFAANNFIAIGALRVLQHAGLRVPADVSLVTFDDLPNYVVEPFVTVVTQPAYELGRQAAELLFARLADEGESLPPQEITLPTRLILRSSVKDLTRMTNGAAG